MHYKHYTHFVHNMHNMHDTQLRERFYQYVTQLHKRFFSTTQHCVSGLNRFIARTVGRRRQPP